MMQQASIIYSRVIILCFMLLVGVEQGFLYGTTAPLFYSPTESILPSNYLESSRALLYSITLGLFVLGAILGNAFLGQLSDMLGRKKLMLLALGLIIIGYFFTIAGLIKVEVVFLMLGKFCQGISIAGSMVALAAILDTCAAESQPSYINLSVIINSLGTVLGCMLVSWLSELRIGSEFDASHPQMLSFIVAGGFSTVNFLLIAFSWQEPKIAKAKTDLNIHLLLMNNIQQLKTIMLEKAKANTLLGILFYWLSWYLVYFVVGVFFTKQFQFSSQQLGQFIAILVVSYTLAAIFINPFINKLKLEALAISALLIMTTGLGLMALYSHELRIIKTLFIIVVCMAALNQTVSTSLFTSLAGGSNLGRVLGISGALQAAISLIIALAIGNLINFSSSLPFFLAACFGVLSILYLFKSLQVKLSQ